MGEGVAKWGQVGLNPRRGGQLGLGTFLVSSMMASGFTKQVMSFSVFLCIFLRNSFWKEEYFCEEIFQVDVQSTKQITQISRPLMVGKTNFL